MAIAPITHESVDLTLGRDGIVWPSVLEEYPGGMTVKLGVADNYVFPLPFIPSGMVVIQNTSTTEWSLLDVDMTDPDNPTYAALPSGWAYAGCVRASKSVKEPFVSAVYAGTANDKAMYLPIPVAVKTAISAALPKLTFKAN